MMPTEKDKAVKKSSETFMKKLLALLAEYDASLEAEDEWSGYAECGEDIHMHVHSSSLGFDIDLGQYFSVKRKDHVSER